MQKLPILYSAHHAGTGMYEFRHRSTLTDEQLVRFSDYGTDVTVPKHAQYQVSLHSRSLIDPNRGLDSKTLHPEYDFGKPEKHKIWYPGQELTPEERQQILERFYKPYHDQMLATVRGFREPGVVMAWDNCAHYAMGKDLATGEPRIMQSYILSNKGDEEVGHSIDPQIITTCDPRFIVELAIEARRELKRLGFCDEVHVNTYGDKPTDHGIGYIAEHYNTQTNPRLGTNHRIEAVELEYDTLLTHDQQTLAPDYNAMDKIRTAFEKAIETVYANLRRWNVGVKLD